jgi:hypothetical protein
MKPRYRERPEPDYVLFEVLNIFLQARTKLRNKDVKRFEDKLQVIIDELYSELKGM